MLMKLVIHPPVEPERGDRAIRVQHHHATGPVSASAIGSQGLPPNSWKPLE